MTRVLRDPEWAWVIQRFNEPSVLNVPPMLVVLGLLWPCPMLGTTSRWSARFTHHKSLLLFIPVWGGWVGHFVQWLPQTSGNTAFCWVHSGELWRRALYKLELTPFFYCVFPSFPSLTPAILHWCCENLKNPEVCYHLFEIWKSKKRRGAALLNITTLITENDIQWGIHFLKKRGW